MNIDFIKWMWELAGGIFSFTRWSDVYTSYGFPIYEHDHALEWWMKDDLFYDVGYPLLLQMAIAGVNRNFFNKGSASYHWKIITDTAEYKVVSHNKNGDIIGNNNFNFSARMNNGKMKESALLYIYEQEKDQ